MCAIIEIIIYLQRHNEQGHMKHTYDRLRGFKQLLHTKLNVYSTRKTTKRNENTMNNIIILEAVYTDEIEPAASPLVSAITNKSICIENTSMIQTSFLFFYTTVNLNICSDILYIYYIPYFISNYSINLREKSTNRIIL